MSSLFRISTFPFAASSAPFLEDVAWPDGFNTFLPIPVDPTRLDDDKYLKATKDKKLWSAAVFDGHRSAPTVREVWALVLDYDVDGTGVHAGEIMDRWGDYEHVLHSSFTPGRFRVILPLDRPVTREEYADVWAWAYERDNRVDTACKDASRAWYWPSVRQHVGRPDLDVPPVFGYNEGERLGVSGILDLRTHARRPSRSPSSRNPTPPTSGPEKAPRDTTEGGADSPYAGIGQATQREDADLIEERCAFMRHARADAAVLKEPEWYAALSILARCRGGDDLAHTWSEPHPGYTYADTEAKYQRAKSESGPRTCREIRLLSPTACKGCTLQVTSPVQLGARPATAPPAPSSDEPAPVVDLESELSEAQARYDQARLAEDAALVAVEAAKKRIRYLRTPTAVASEEDLPAAVKALGDAKEQARVTERLRAREERALAAVRARVSVAGLPPGAAPDVWQRLFIEKGDRPKASVGNVMTILSCDPRWSSRLGYDAFSLEVCVDRAPLPEEIGTELTAKLSWDYNLDAKTDVVLECIRAVAKRRSFHPVQEWLGGLTWDGTPRARDLLHLGFGASPTPDDEVLRKVGEKFLLALVARAMRPGVKADAMLVLVGKQGSFKSTSLEKLVGEEWFGSSKLDLASKDSYMQLRGKLLWEVAELDSMKKVEASTSKQWLSNRVDVYRAPYARRAESHPRQTVMAGTTNEDEFLMDPTGWRRYHPVAVGVADLDWIVANREQLFAEAVVRYKAGEQWWFNENSDDAERLARLVAPFQSTHPWEEVLYGWLLARKTPEPFTAVDVLRAALGRTPGDLTHAEKTTVGHILVHRLRCQKVRGTDGMMTYLRPAYMPAISGPTKVIEYPSKKEA